MLLDRDVDSDVYPDQPTLWPFVPSMSLVTT